MEPVVGKEERIQEQYIPAFEDQICVLTCANYKMQMGNDAFEKER